MSIKKGKKQVYKVGDRVEVLRCVAGSPSHVGKQGEITKVFPPSAWSNSESYSIEGKCCADKVRLLPLKPKKGVALLKKTMREGKEQRKSLTKQYYDSITKPKKSIKKMKECEHLWACLKRVNGGFGGSEWYSGYDEFFCQKCLVKKVVKDY